MTRLLALISLTCLAAACNSYDPDLGTRPFKCGTEDSCPNGYTCNVDKLCEKAAAGPSVDASTEPQADARPFQCLDDSEVEPNDSLGSATRMEIPQKPVDRLANLSICPDTDVDLYRFELVTQTNVTAEMTYQSSQGELIVDVLESGGDSIRTAVPVGGNNDFLRADIPNVPVGIYYLQVRAPVGVRNNYSFEIRTSQ